MFYKRMCLSDTVARSSATRTENTADRSGWIMLDAMAVKQTLHSADIMAGESTIVITVMTSQYPVTLTLHHWQVRNVTVVVLLFCVRSTLPSQASIAE